ncbi:MAG: DNA polymerase III subunit alpha [Pyrinomonadaceae bacterium]
MAKETESLNFKSRDFVHLHLHSDYSLLQSTIQLKHLAKKLAEMEMKACALTDYANLYGAVTFYKTMKESGVRPIIGYEAAVAPGGRMDKGSSVISGERPYYQLIILAKDLTGYRNLVHLSSKAFTEGLHHVPRIDVDLLSSHSEGLIGISAGQHGEVGHFLRRDDEARAVVEAKKYEDIFGAGNFYIEVQEQDGEFISKLADLSKSAGLPLVATNNAHYVSADDARAHEVLRCIGEGRTLVRNVDIESTRYVRSAEEMWQIFGKDLPDSLTNTLKIAEMCKLEIPMGAEHLAMPDYPLQDGYATSDEYFEHVIRKGFEERRLEVWQPMKQANSLKHSTEEYRSRLDIEIETIRNMGFAGYFLIVWDFIKYARQQGIPVGPGRGSAAGSLAAYCLRITDVDPLQYDLLFERFLNPERVSMPDIDIDFCIRGRADVINHVTELYGRDSVCQIITFGTMASKAAIKDVGRALNMPYGEVEKIAKLIPPPYRGRNISISKAIQTVPELKKAIDTDAQIKDLVDLALRVEGCSRHTSVHAAGVVISPKPLQELIPVAISSKNELTSQYPMNDLEKVGMLKMDFLGLTTLTVISDCLKALKQKAGIEIEWTKVPLNDEKTMAMFGEGRTEAIFQFESSGMQEICRRIRPKDLEDLSALNALYRPGPIDGGMIEDFILRHRGEKRVEYLIPEMEEILSNTFGVLVYQEQIMQLAQKLAGYSLGDADLMRRAMGKKKHEEMAVHSAKFIDGAVSRGFKREHAKEIFGLMAQFADYGFNRSHSVAYAYLAFQTGYLKAHFPAYFYASVLSHEAQDAAKVYKYSNELRSIGLKLLPPDINESDDGFTPLDDAVRFGLTAIKGIGSASVGAIVNARRDGPFTSLFDLVSRLDQSSLNRRAVESLITSGAFDSLMPDEDSINHWRAMLYTSTDNVLVQGQRAWEDRLRGQNALFGADDLTDRSLGHLNDAEPWSQAEISRQEKAAIGFYLSVHPLDNSQEILSDLDLPEISSSADRSSGDPASFAGIVSGLQVRYSKKGNRFGIFRLEDRSGGIKCLAWGEAFQKFSVILADDELVVASGKIEAGDGQEVTLIVNDVKLLSDAVAINARHLSIDCGPDEPHENYFEDLFSVLSRDVGTCEVSLRFPVKGVAVKMVAQVLRIKGSGRLQKELEAKGCSVEWK